MLSWWDGLTRIARRPRIVYNRLRIVARDGRCRREREQWLSGVTGAPPQDLRGYISEIEHDREFIRAVRLAYREHTVYLPSPTDFMVEPAGGGSMFFHLVSLYALVRSARPQRIVETGGTPGKSSAFILRAMQRNGEGELYTIDLPPAKDGRPLVPSPTKGEQPLIGPSQSHDLLSGDLCPGWCIPADLRGRHRLLIGPAQVHLPALLQQLGRIDIFIHDSDHSYAHMLWEFRTAFPHVRPGGYIWSDDILGNAAWDDFCQEARLDGSRFLSQGAARKR